MSNIMSALTANTEPETYASSYPSQTPSREESITDNEDTLNADSCLLATHLKTTHNKAESTQFLSEMDNFLINQQKDEVDRVIKKQKKEEPEDKNECEVLTQVTLTPTKDSDKKEPTICSDCKYEECHNEKYGQYCVLGMYDYCHTTEEVCVSWYSARSAFRKSYKEILRSTTFLETNYYDSNEKKYDLPSCMIEGKMEEAKVIYMHKIALRKVERCYKDGAVFLKRLLPYEIEQKKRARS